MGGMSVAKIDWPNVEPRFARDGSIRAWVYRIRERDPITKKMKTIRLPLPRDETSKEFAAAYEAARERHKPSPATPFSFDHLIKEYRASSRFEGLSASSQREYGRCLDYFMKNIGGYDARSWTRSLIYEMREQNSHRPRIAEYQVQVMSILMQFAIDLEWRTDNPALKLTPLKREKKEHLPWADWFVEAMLEETRGALHTAIRLGLAIGPRPGDVVALRWEQFDGEGIDYAQSKTKGGAYGLLLPDMVGFLNELKTRSRGLTIVQDERTGRPMTYQAIRQRFDKVRHRIGGREFTMHGWRKNATITLAEAGCTNDQIKAITGHSSDRMVAHYGKGARRKHAAREAIAKVTAMKGTK